MIGFLIVLVSTVKIAHFGIDESQLLSNHFENSIGDHFQAYLRNGSHQIMDQLAE